MQYPRLTINLPCWAAADLERLASILGASVSQVVSALLELLPPQGSAQTSPSCRATQPITRLRVHLTPPGCRGLLVLWDAAWMMGLRQPAAGMLVESVLSDFLGELQACDSGGGPDLISVLDRIVPGGLLTLYRTVHRLS